MAQERDPKVLEILERTEKQEPYIEEFLLRMHKTADDIKNFLETYGEKLHGEIKEYLEQMLKEYDILPTANRNHDDL